MKSKGTACVGVPFPGCYGIRRSSASRSQMPPLGMQTESVAKHVPYDPSIPPSLCSPSAAPRGGGGGKQGMAEGEDGLEKRMLADERGGRQDGRGEDKGDEGAEIIQIHSLRDHELLAWSLNSSGNIWPRSLRSPRGP